MSEKKFQIGVIGLGVMGANLARNFASKGFDTLVFNRTFAKTEEFLKEFGGEESKLEGVKSLEELVNGLAKPRKILLMVQAGSAVDEVMISLSGLLEKGDIIIDGGNSFYHDSQRRFKLAAEKGLEFVGMGVSGGEEGALNGPSLMPGCSVQAWSELKPFLEKVAARDFGGKACVSRIGEGGAGHFVKMVHNGIEYGIMQLIAETYQLMKMAGLGNDEIAKQYEQLEKSKIAGFLTEITAKVLRKRTAEGEFLIDVILDKAAQKGTGAWTAVEGLNHGVPVSSISEAVLARSLSSFKNMRVEMEEMYGDFSPGKFVKKNWNLEKVLLAGMTIIYAQGWHLIKEVSDKQKWGVQLAETARIWQGGCIIRSKLLVEFAKMLDGENLLLNKNSKELLWESGGDLRVMVLEAVENGVAVPVAAGSLGYFDGMKV
ncbi:MAG: NADP-dependent phosphogluconate dehydrogenase, partial [Candidatus Altimarinota bacterium]